MPLVKVAESVLLECLSPYERAYRGVREANTALRGLNDLLEEQVRTESFLGSVDLEPLKALTVSIGPSITNLSGNQIRYTRFYSLIATASYPIQSWLRARAIYRYGFEEVSGSGSNPCSIFSLSLEAAYPSRVR